MTRVLITTVPFGDKNRYPLDLLDKEGISYVINPLGKKLTEDELIDVVDDCDVIVAGTESITDRVMAEAKNLRMISRVGIGLDSIDLLAAEKRKIAVSYTPDAPTPAVAELTIGLMYSLIRHVHESNILLHRGHWHRFFGKRLANCTIGIIGMGRVGGLVCKHLRALGCRDIIYNDINVIEGYESSENIRFSDKKQIYRNADIISLHVPLTSSTKNMISKNEIDEMKSDAFLINTSRGGIINERELYKALKKGKLIGAAIDVFENEPYYGDFGRLDNCLITAHLGSMSVDCRSRMEIEATEEAVRYIKQRRQNSAVPKEEYEVQRQGL